MLLWTRGHWVVAVAAVSAAAGSAAGSSAPPARQVWAWADGDPAIVAQWTNASWRGVFDGVQASCGVNFVAISPDEVALVVNDTVFDGCRPLQAAVHASGGAFHVWTNGVPPECLTSAAAAQSAITSAAAVAAQYGLDGLSLDDEADCAPRSTLANFTLWSHFVDTLASALHADGRELSAAVQAMFGIQDVPYAPRCSPPQDPSCSQACVLPPWQYAPNADVVALMAANSIDRWLEMDTYYFSTARFLNALDFYVTAVPASKLAVSVENRADLTDDDRAARFHALDHGNAGAVDRVNVFMLPADDAWLQWLRKWKTRCANCPNAGILSCYEPSVPC